MPCGRASNRLQGSGEDPIDGDVCVFYDTAAARQN